MAKRSIIFWNIQRLFGSAGSPIAQALALDGDVPPSTKAGIEYKIATIAAVIDRIAELAGSPILVGFAEIENRALASSIAKAVRSSRLVDVDSAARDQTGFALDGLNLSLLFDADAFEGVELLQSHIINRTFDTRDILEVDLRLRSGLSMSALVNHWPSRVISEGASRRLTAAHYAYRIFSSKVRFPMRQMWNADRSRIDVPNASRITTRARRPVVVMGDFNDEVFDASLALLNTTPEPTEVASDLRVTGRTKKERFRSYVFSIPRLHNPFWSFVGHAGSFYRSPRWRTYDQILLSRGFVEDNSKIPFLTGSASIFDEPEVVRADGATVPLTNRGGKPLKFDGRDRGCSDHFPVVVSVDLPT